ncbi:MAG: hypothetical protein ACM3JG_14790 [Thiohalocapsa sp.]
MSLFRLEYRHRPPFVLRHLDRAAAHLNGALLVIALSLAMLDFLCIAQHFIDHLPPPANGLGASMPLPVTPP